VQARSIAQDPVHIHYTVRVVNTGPVSGAVSVLALLSSEHSDAVTNSKLVDFAKTAILPPGGSELVRLVRAHYVLFQTGLYTY
jgi:hypothetical protein